MSIVKFEPETRRVQLTGGATLIVSLPKEWTRQVDLKPGDEVLVIPQPDLSLLVVPKKMVKAPLLESSISVNQDLSNIDHLERVLLAHYLSGYDIFKLNFDITTLDLKRQVKDIVRRKLTGVEIIEEGRNSLVIQNLVNVPDINIRDILVKLVKTVVGMIDDLRTPIENGDKAIATDIVERDNEVDKFYWLLNRQLKRILISKHALSLSGLQDPRSIIEYAIINKSLTGNLAALTTASTTTSSLLLTLAFLPLRFSSTILKPSPVSLESTIFIPISTFTSLEPTLSLYKSLLIIAELSPR